MRDSGEAQSVCRGIFCIDKNLGNTIGGRRFSFGGRRFSFGGRRFSFGGRRFSFGGRRFSFSQRYGVNSNGNGFII